MITRQKLHTLNYEVLDYLPYSPDLLPTDFQIFKHLDNFLLEKCFRNPKEAQTAFNEFVTSRTTSFYDGGIKILVLVAKMCIEANCSYFDL